MYTTCLAKAIKKSVILTVNQWGAMVQWTMNHSCTQLVNDASWLTRINSGQDVNTVLAQELPKWDKVKGKPFTQLATRRASEVKLAMTHTDQIAFPPC